MNSILGKHELIIEKQLFGTEVYKRFLSQYQGEGGKFVEAAYA
jgi:hypothetical protein